MCIVSVYQALPSSLFLWTGQACFLHTQSLLFSLSLSLTIIFEFFHLSLSFTLPRACTFMHICTHTHTITPRTITPSHHTPHHHTHTITPTPSHPTPSHHTPSHHTITPHTSSHTHHHIPHITPHTTPSHTTHHHIQQFLVVTGRRRTSRCYLWSGGGTQERPTTKQSDSSHWSLQG